jgi:heptosyltransferase-3
VPAKQTFNRIIISRPDAIGDVILTLPLCGIIKKYYPNAEIIFLGKTYTQPVINCCEHVDKFINADELLKLNDSEASQQLKALKADALIHVFPNKRIAVLAKKAGIKVRIGTRNRLFHWSTVNKLVKLSRKNSPLHESQLNCKLLIPLDIDLIPGLKEMANYIGFTKITSLNKTILSWLDKDKANVILHPKSNGSGREWDLNNYKALINLLPGEKYKIFISGTDKDKLLLSPWIETLPAETMDITGKLTLTEFISFISKADHLVASGTGPLHIAAAAGINAIGIFPPIKPIHPVRWQPIGKNSHAVCVNKSCNDCRSQPQQCHCMNEVSPAQIASLIEQNGSK